MPAIVVVGAQWGDEGKGKIIDCLADEAHVVVRTAGGPNAGHTLVVGQDRLVLRLVPSGVLRAGVRCLMAQGMVVDAWTLVQEMDELGSRGVDVTGRLYLSDRAHLILPHHVAADHHRESGGVAGPAIGTTRRGIGPAYEDKVARRGVRAGMLRNMDRLAERLQQTLEAWRPLFAAWQAPLPSLDDTVERLQAVAGRLCPLLADTSAMLDTHLRAGERVLFEGAQGTLLDIDHGTYPFVTSSSAVAAGACVGAGVGPGVIDRVLGVAKAYTTRVGSGPFPTEHDESIGETIRRVGAEFGSVTGRPRRTGWLDLPLLRYAVRVNGIGGLALTKLDVLTGVDPVRVCVAYETPEGHAVVPPSHWAHDIADCRPVYVDLPGWSEPISNTRSVDDLPKHARAYVRFVERECGVGCDLISVGASRDAIMTIRHPFAC